MPNPLISDRELAFLLDEVLDLHAVLAWPAFAEHDRASVEAYLDACRRLAREALWPSYRAIDAEPPVFRDGRVHVHPRLSELWPKLRELGIIGATRPVAVGGQALPLTVSLAAQLYLMAGNLSAYGYAGLTSGAGHLVEVFGSAELRARYLPQMYEGRWTGTMALTEPHAGSSLADLTTVAVPAGDHYLLTGAKIFISGGDHDLAENIVHMVLARIVGAPPGVRGISLFLVPARRPEGDRLVPNDVRVTGLIHKIGWRGIPSLALSFGDEGDCRGWLVGEPHRGLTYMFQMMNEARIMIGANGVATASVGYHESLAYARERPQGRPADARADATRPQIPIIEHADVRRMLLRQKAIVEGGLGLVLHAARLADASEHAPTAEEQARARRQLDLLTPIVKTFPAERGFEANALALQIHGGYGYSSEYVPEALLRDQKLNTIHEGTSGIQGLDLLGRKAMAEGGLALRELIADVEAVCARAATAGVDEAWAAALREASATVGGLTAALGARGLGGDVAGMLLHSADYLELCSIWVIGWQWLAQAAVARAALAAGRGEARGDAGFYEGKLAAAQYWLRTELPRIPHLAALCRDAEDSYARMRPDWF
ncbi:MAG TPA: acyl-CoA dehydrogenase [Kofleriaceae bacterium]|nr:acyl-CoA dehydrogenase [Kofleriaceae bacterium]